MSVLGIHSSYVRDDHGFADGGGLDGLPGAGASGDAGGSADCAAAIGATLPKKSVRHFAISAQLTRRQRKLRTLRLSPQCRWGVPSRQNSRLSYSSRRELAPGDLLTAENSTGHFISGRFHQRITASTDVLRSDGRPHGS